VHDINEDSDELIGRIVSELKTLPPVPADATARVLARVDAARRSETPGRFSRRFIISLPAAIGYALAATLAGFLIRGALPRRPEPTFAQVPNPPVAETLGTRTTIVPASANRRALQEAPVKVQFVLDAKGARSVAVVGDFNNWDGSAMPLERDSRTGAWTAVVDVRPGRHLYAFLVDGTVWTLDPNAPRARDSDYGTEQSVMMVGLQ
jgi:hypothetical protein